MNLLCYIAIFVILLHLIYADQTIQCGDWDVFKDEKCFKVFNNSELQNFNDANKICYENEGSSLVTIRSQEEQDFLYNLLANVHKSVNDVWIGAQFSEQRIKWTENVTENYTNWANGYPINDSGYECVLMKMVEPSHGKWLNEPCIRNHSVVCQKQQNWLFSYLQKNVMQLRESFEKYVEHTNAELDTTKKALETTKSDLEKTKTDLADSKTKLENTEKLLLEKTREASPAGSIAYFTVVTPPLGWLKANGQSVSRTQYANLFETLGTRFGSGDGSTSFTLPDLRGEFIRSWSDGRNVDINRSFGSFQIGSSIPFVDGINKNGYKTMGAGWKEQWTTFAGATFDEGFINQVQAGETRAGITFPNDGVKDVVHFGNADTDGHITAWNVLSGARPRNIALLACIKV